MNTFTADEMLAVARHVYPKMYTSINDAGDGVIFSANGAGVWADFSPSLTGTDREQADACQCIVAAFSSPGVFECKIDQHGKWFFWYWGANGCAYTTKPGDLLSASISAILSHVGEK